jgi:hypothetical protein
VTEVTEKQLQALRYIHRMTAGSINAVVSGGSLGQNLWPETWALGSRKRSGCRRGGGAMLSRLAAKGLVYTDRWRYGTPCYRLTRKGHEVVWENEGCAKTDGEEATA